MAGIVEVPYIWKNGKLIPWNEAQTHVLTHSLHYGSAAFEGIRCYENPEDGSSYVFRLKEHMDRLIRSAKIAEIDIAYSSEELCEATVELLRANNLKSAYIRPLVYHGYGVMGINTKGCPVDVIIAAWPWGRYLGEAALEEGIAAGISSWRQRSNNALPPAVKSTASYMNSLLAKREALANGFAEAILLNEEGKVCEGSGENLFIVKDNVLITPPVSDGLLDGVTRRTIMQLASEFGYEVREQSLVRCDLYIADEVFFTGTAAEVTPVKSVDGRTIGKPGPVTKRLQKRYFECVYGQAADHSEWLTCV